MFNELNLKEDIQRALEAKGFVIPTEIQSQCIPLILDGLNVLGRSQTGTGKTFAFGLPAINKIDPEIKSVQVLAVCPTRELAMQVTDELRKITQYQQSINVVPIYGGANIDRQIKALKNAKIVVGTPGRLMDHLRRKTLKLQDTKMIVLDEADEMLNMGFRDDIETILKSAPKERQTVMFSATMPTAIKAITKEYMVEPVYVEIGNLNSTIDEIDQSYIRVSVKGKKNALLELFERLNPERTIIFCNTKKMVDEVKKLLISKDIKALALHGDMRQSERKKVITDIKNHKVSTLVATDVAARGIDIIDVEYIINYDLPKDVEFYIHRIGRTGRAGKSGKAISLINSREQLMFIDEFRKKTNSLIIEHTISETMESFYDIKAKGSNNGQNAMRTNNGSSNRSRNNSQKSYSSNKGKSSSNPRNADARPKRSYEKKGSSAEFSSNENRSFSNPRNADERPKRRYEKKGSSAEFSSNENRSFSNPRNAEERPKRRYEKKGSSAEFSSNENRSFSNPRNGDEIPKRRNEKKDSSAEFSGQEENKTSGYKKFYKTKTKNKSDYNKKRKF